jgi:two-component system chemotaxis sensor kinase CheA
LNPKVDLSEFISGFLAEADELLALANQSLLAAETAAKSGGSSPRSVRDAFRALHTIKGLSAMVEVEPIVALAHRMETLLRGADQGAALTPNAIEALLQGVRAIELRVKALRDQKPVPEAPIALLQRIENVDAQESGEQQQKQEPLALDLEPELFAKLAPMDRDQLLQGVAAGKTALRAEFTPTPAKAEAGVTITTLREQLKSKAEIVKVLPRSLPATASAPGGLSFVLLLLSVASIDELLATVPNSELQLRALKSAPRKAASPADAPLENPGEEVDDDDGDSGQRRGLIRVEVSRLDDTMEKLSALIVTRFRMSRAVAELAARGVDVRQLSQIMAENGRQLRDLRGAVLHVRMVRVADVLERVPLLVRGLQRSTGKKVRLELEPGQAEVDKAVADRLFPAIIHLVRNAIDHALETPRERKALGKPEEGLLRISCVNRGGNKLELSVEDDGRGVDREKVARRAGRATPKTDAALLDLLCLPGLSTRDELSTTSGRGMGMDIVRGVAVSQLGGEMILQTRPGAGTTFTLRVPLTVTIVDAFSFECAGARFVTPVSSIEEIIEIDPQTLSVPPGDGKVSMTQRRGEALPVLQLANLFRLPSNHLATRALVVRRAGEATAIAVHKLLGQQEVVVRPLEDPLVRVPGISGATDLGDGKPVLVLDLIAVANTALREVA